ncbi:MAG: hypothetical protein OHK006_11070 [Thermodesulfovibrionales bacterium]
MSRKRVLILLMSVLAMSLIIGCSHMERAPKDRPGYLYYHKPLPEAARLLDDARAAGKDKECPAEFNAARDKVDKAYEIYIACRTQEAITMANEAISQIKALCPSKPKTESAPNIYVQVAPQGKGALFLPKQKAGAVTAPQPKPQETKQEPATVKIVLEDVHFDFDKATLSKEAKAILARNKESKEAKENRRVHFEVFAQ